MPTDLHEPIAVRFQLAVHTHGVEADPDFGVAIGISAGGGIPQIVGIGRRRSQDPLMPLQAAAHRVEVENDDHAA